MDAGLLAVLTDAERLLVAETERAVLEALDEDQAVALHVRVRRARGKYVGQYRRAAAARVPEQGGRGKARPANTRARQKAEVFEEALSRVSARLGVLAAEAAQQLKAERLELAQSVRWGGTGGDGAGPMPRDSSVAGGPSGDRALRNPASEKRRADTTAAGARRQAKRDSR
jgi:hypothetical protein